MRVLAFSDVHRDTAIARSVVDASRDADVVVGAGDYGTKGEGTSEILRVLAGCRAPLVVVHGNHDDPEEMRALCAHHPDVHYLHGTAAELAGVTFFGVGGEIPMRTQTPWNVAESETAAARMLGRCPSRDTVLVTHTPPFGHADAQQDGAHHGSTAIRDAIRAKQPALHLCGHVHNGWGLSARIGETRVINLGPDLYRFEI